MAIRQTALLLAIAAIFASVAPTHAGGEVVWVTTGGPTGAVINALIAPTNVPGALLAGTNGGIYLTRDGGAHWQASFAGLADLAISSLATSPDATLIYAGTRSGIYRSRDGGARWSRSDPRLADQLILSLVVDPQNSLIGYASTATNIFKTENGGEEWNEIAQALRPIQVWSLTLAQDSTTLYAVTDSGIHATTDRGAHWSKFVDRLADETRAQALAATDRGFFVATTKGLYKSKDGKTWSALSSGITSRLVHPLAIDPRDSNRIFAVTVRGVSKSLDAGASWSPLANTPTDAPILTILVSPKGTVYLGTARGVWRTEDDGSSWQLVNVGLTGSSINSLLVAPTGPDALLAATQFGIWYSRDRGATWLESLGVSDPHILSLIADPGNAQVLYAGTYSGAVLLSKDGGAKFARLASTIGNKAPVASLSVLHPASNSTTLFAGTLGEGVYWTNDEGKTWSAQSNGLGSVPRVSALGLVSPSMLLAGTDHGLYRLEPANPSAVWSVASPTLPLDQVNALVIEPRERKTLFVLFASSGVYKSADAGATWVPLGQGAFPNRTRFQTLVQRADNPSVLYLGNDHGVYRTKDGGSSWVPLSDGLRPGADIQTIAIDPHSPDRVFIGTNAYGVLSATDSISIDEVPWLELGAAAALILGAIVAAGILVRVRRRPRSARPPMVRPKDPSDSIITHALWSVGEASQEHLPGLTRDALPRALLHYMEQHADDGLTLNASATSLKLDNYTFSHEFFGDWQVAREAANDSEAFAAITSEMVEQLCMLLGFARVDERDFKGLIGYVVRAPSLRLKIPSRFPIVFMPPRELSEEDMGALRDLLGVLDLAGYFALLIDLHDSSEVAQHRTLKRLAREAIYDFIVLDEEDLHRLFAARDPVRRLVERILEQVDLSVISPYVISGPVPDNMFFGREHELKTILRTIRYTNFAIVGGRKIGKTSVLARVYRLLRESSEFQPMYLDCQAVHSDADFYEAVDALWQPPLPSRSPEGFRRLMLSLLDNHPNRCLVLLFDEVDALLQFDAARGEHLFHIFRALSQEKQVHFVFCGEKELNKALQDPRLVFFNFCNVLPLSYLTPTEAQRVVTEPMQDMGITLDSGTELADRIVKESAGHPNILQYVCQKLIERINARQATCVLRADVDAVIASTEFGEYVTAIIWGNSDPLERLMTLLMLDCREMTASAMAVLLRERQALVTPNQLQNALDGLCLASILRRDGPKYTLANDKFAEALRRTQDIDGLFESLVKGIHPESGEIYEAR